MRDRAKVSSRQEAFAASGLQCWQERGTLAVRCPAMSGIEGASKFGFSDLDLTITAGASLARDVKIFRVGTFTNSAGKTRTWTHDDLDAAVENFRILRDNDSLPNIPVREDHTQSIKDVVGYFTDVRRVGDFLIADWEWASADAQSKWDQKQYRNKSVEIGQYVQNDGTKYDPVVLGLAFVDLPAVEGLYRIADHGDDMPNKDDSPTAEEVAAAAEKAATDQAAADKAMADAVAAQAVADQAAAKAADDQAAADKAAELVGSHGDGQPPPHKFSIADTEVNDYAKVQAHIVELETFRKETIEGGRTSFIDALVEGKVVTGPQAEKFRSLVLTMDESQFDAFKEGFEGMAPANLFGRHDLGEGGSSGEPDARTDRISVLEAIVANHRARGAQDDEIHKMGSYKELETLKSATA